MGTVGALTVAGVKVGLAAALAIGGVVAARYLQQARFAWRPAARLLRVLETAALGPQRAIHLVAIGSRTLLVASTQGQITMLADVTGEGDCVSHEPPTAPSFSAVISRLLPSRELPSSSPSSDLQAAAARLKLSSAGMP